MMPLQGKNVIRMKIRSMKILMIEKKVQKEKRGRHVLKCIGMLAVLCGILGMCIGCGNGKGTVKPQSGVTYYSPEKNTETEAKVSFTGSKLYMILSIDSAEESMILYSYSNGLQYRYHYGLDTEFLDKYGTRTSVVRFGPGKVVTVGKVSADGVVSAVQVSDQVWQYDDIKRFSIDKEHKALKIADSNYSYNDDTIVFSNEEIAGFDDITSSDILSVVGIDKKILSVNITTGHGILSLQDTELFDGSYLQLDKKVFAEITSDMSMELPEGNYTLTVANDGWGGSQDITIARGETTTVNLDAIKGEGPKSGKILFAIGVANAVVKVDGVPIDYANPIELKYGRHAIEVKADGYETWSRTLYVNSAEATIIIDLSTESEETDTGTTSGTTSNNNSNSSSGSGSSSGTTSSGNTTNKNSETQSSSEKEEIDSDYLKDYLSTLSDTLTSLTK